MAEPGDILQKQLADEIGKTITITKKLEQRYQASLLRLVPTILPLKEQSGGKPY